MIIPGETGSSRTSHIHIKVQVLKMEVNVTVQRREEPFLVDFVL
jgi:hypothetical protein